MPHCTCLCESPSPLPSKLCALGNFFFFSSWTAWHRFQLNVRVWIYHLSFPGFSNRQRHILRLQSLKERREWCLENKNRDKLSQDETRGVRWLGPATWRQITQMQKNAPAQSSIDLQYRLSTIYRYKVRQTHDRRHRETIPMCKKSSELCDFFFQHVRSSRRKKLTCCLLLRRYRRDIFSFLRKWKVGKFCGIFHEK